MEQKLKELLIKDLCSRLPYSLKVKRPDDGTPDYVSAIDIETGELMVMYNGYTTDIEKFRPYLRPLSSMTEEEINEFILISDTVLRLGNKMSTCILSLEQMDWLNKKMFDYRGLIEKGLAIDITKEGNPYEQS